MLVGKTSLSLACRLSEDFHFRPLDCFGAPGAPVSFSCTGLDSAQNPIQSNPNRALVQKLFLHSSLPIQLLIVLYNVQTRMQRKFGWIQLLQELKTFASKPPAISVPGNQLLRPRCLHILESSSIWESMFSLISTITGTLKTSPGRFIPLYEIP